MLGSSLEDLRGRHTHHKTVSSAAKDYVRSHINSYPAVDSHYCRKTSSRKYLPEGLAINEMYRQYVITCEEDRLTPVKSHIYRDIFCTEYNFGFHVPKKDQCATCNKYKNCITGRGEMEESYQHHQRRKEEAHKMKNDDKDNSIANNNICVVTFDLQKVLCCPSGKVGTIFYKRKLATYNLTVFNLASRDGYNYMWDESKAKRGSCEIASCIWKFLNTLPDTIDNVILYSDSYGGQNRNVQMATMLLCAVKCLKIKQIDFKFLESGHTQMEVDAMRACIEKASKSVDVFLPRDWSIIASTARKTGKPYIVNRMETMEIIDWKSVCSTMITNRNKADNGVIINWNSVKWLQFRSEDDIMRVKYELDDSQFMNASVRRATRGRPMQSGSIRGMMKPLYDRPVPISKAKYNDLMFLCKKHVIPLEQHTYYKDPVNSDSVRDILDEPDAEEMSGDEQ